MQNSERGKKIGNAMMTTSRSVVQTGKVVGERNVNEKVRQPKKIRIGANNRLITELFQVSLWGGL